LCYPYGNYNETTIELLIEFKCKIALTTIVDIDNLQKYNNHTLPMLDINDIPKDQNATTNDWYFRG
jgi:hypothetical protein